MADWDGRFEAYREGPSRAGRRARRRPAGPWRRLPDRWADDLPAYATGTEVATRNASQDASRRSRRTLPELFGGAADLSESNLTDVKGERRTSAPTSPAATSASASASTPWAASPTGSPTTAASCPYVGTFLNFSDYMRGSVRLAALSGLHVIYVWTHDSVGLGEDGPTHQPVEHYAALRAMPNLWFIRPGDANEAVAAWAPGRSHRGRAGRRSR